MNVSKYVGEKIRFYRTNKKVTQQELGEYLNTTSQTISRYENGILEANHDVLFKLAEYFKISINDFFPPLTFDVEDKLKKMIIEKFGSVKQFAVQIDIPYTTVDTILKRGIDNSNVTNVTKMCKGLNISVDKLIDEHKIINIGFDNAELVNLDSDIIKIAVYGTIKAGIPIESQPDIIDYVEIPRKWTIGGKKFYGLKISGDSMFPKYSENDIVIFEQNDDSELYNGKDVAVMINGTESTFKKLLVNDSSIVLQPYNTSYDIMMFTKEQVEQLPIRIVGIAIEKRTKL